MVFKREEYFYYNILKGIKHPTLFLGLTQILLLSLIYRERISFISNLNSYNYYYWTLKEKVINSGEFIFKNKSITNCEGYFSILLDLINIYSINEYNLSYEEIKNYIDCNIFKIRQVITRIWYNRKDSYNENFNKGIDYIINKKNWGKSYEYLCFENTIIKMYPKESLGDKALRGTFYDVEKFEYERAKKMYFRKVAEEREINNPYGGCDESFGNGFPYDTGGMWIEG
jgi:hypothetical protein